MDEIHSRGKEMKTFNEYLEMAKSDKVYDKCPNCGSGSFLKYNSDDLEDMNLTNPKEGKWGECKDCEAVYLKK